MRRPSDASYLKDVPQSMDEYDFLNVYFSAFTHPADSFRSRLGTLRRDPELKMPGSLAQCLYSA
jgi:hypothetical protein